MRTTSTECLDRLLGDRSDKLRSLPPYTNPAVFSRVAPIYSSASSSCTSTQVQPACLSNPRPQYAHIQPQPPCYLLHAASYPSNTLNMYSHCGQPTSTGSLNSTIASMMPPTAAAAALQADYSVGPRSMQEFLLEGDASCDIDMLNPSLTELQLQGTGTR